MNFPGQLIRSLTYKTLPLIVHRTLGWESSPSVRKNLKRVFPDERNGSITARCIVPRTQHRSSYQRAINLNYPLARIDKRKKREREKEKESTTYRNPIWTWLVTRGSPRKISRFSLSPFGVNNSSYASREIPFAVAPGFFTRFWTPFVPPSLVTLSNEEAVDADSNGWSTTTVTTVRWLCGSSRRRRIKVS